MYPRTAEAGLLVRRSHHISCVMDVLHGGRWVTQLSFIDGQVTAQGGRSVTRNFSGSVVDPTGALDGSDIDDLLSPYDCEIAPYRGVLLANGSYEMAPLGVFQLTNREVMDFSTMSLAGQDRALIYQGPMDSALGISAGTSVESAIHLLLAKRNSALSMHTWVTGFTCGPLLYSPDIDVWKEAQELAKSVGGLLYHDRHGVLVFEPGLPINENPVTSYAHGDGVLLSANRSEDADTVHNVVVAQSSKAGVAGIVRATAEDTDPTSPTYAMGKYGRRVITISNQHLGSTAQAQQMAVHELSRELGRSETSTIEILVDPFRDPGDVTLLNYPQKGLDNRSLVVDSVTTPLKAKSSMELVLRRSIVGQDGRVLDNGVTLDGN